MDLRGMGAQSWRCAVCAQEPCVCAAETHEGSHQSDDAQREARSNDAIQERMRRIEAILERIGAERFFELFDITLDTLDTDEG